MTTENPLSQLAARLSALKTDEAMAAALTELLKEKSIPFEIQKDGKTCNILAGNLNLSEKRPLICAHYDVIEGSSGANDNLSSVSILVHLLKSHPDSFTAAFLDQEESGHLGARLLLERMKDKNIRPEYILVLDTCGYGDTETYRIRNGRFDRSFRKMTSAKQKKKYHLLSLSCLPESDDALLCETGAPVMLISMMPEPDTRSLKAVHDYYGFLSPYSSAAGEALDQLEVMQTIHNGPFDDPKILMESAMRNVLNHLQETLN